MTVWPPAHLTVVAACLPEQANGHLATCFSTRSSKMGLRHTVPPPALRHTVPPPALRHTVPPRKLLWKAGGVTTAPACTIKAALKVRPSAHHVVSQRAILSSCAQRRHQASQAGRKPKPVLLVTACGNLTQMAALNTQEYRCSPFSFRIS